MAEAKLKLFINDNDSLFKTINNMHISIINLYNEIYLEQTRYIKLANETNQNIELYPADINSMNSDGYLHYKNFVVKKYGEILPNIENLTNEIRQQLFKVIEKEK